MSSYAYAARHTARRTTNSVPRWVLAGITAVIALFAVSVAVGYHLAGDAAALTATPPAALLKTLLALVVGAAVASRIT